MKLIKRIFAEIHMFVASLWNPMKTIFVSLDQEVAKTPIGELNMTHPHAMVEKETITWYGVRKVITYWKHDRSTILGSRVMHIIES